MKTDGSCPESKRVRSGARVEDSMFFYHGSTFEPMGHPRNTKSTSRDNLRFFFKWKLARDALVY